MQANRLIIPILAVVLVGCQVEPEETGTESEPSSAGHSGYIEQVEKWRKEREERLREPYGWLSLAAMARLDSERFTIGSGPENDLVVARGPERWGTLLSQDDRVVFEPGPDFEGSANGRESGSVTMEVGTDRDPTHVEAEGIRVHLIERPGGLFVRVRDPASRAREGFAGLDWYPVDPEWAIVADFEPHPDGTTLEIADVTGEIAERASPGVAVFTRDGREHRLEAVESASGDQLWFILADRTSGRATYGLGRFLYTDLPRAGRVTLDFNKAYNPPCAFNEYTTCPLPPPGNRLDLQVTAGERAYPGTTGTVPKAVDGSQ